MNFSFILSTFLPLFSFSSFNNLHSKNLIEEKCLDYTKMVKESDYTKYDSVYFDYENGPVFLDTELENITENDYKNRPESFFNDSPSSTQNLRDASGIFYPDTRVSLTSTQCASYPYTAVCKILREYVDGDGITWYAGGTGALVGPNVFLTASHCVYDENLGWPTKFEVYPAYYYGENLNYGHASMVGASVGVVFNTHDANDDWAIVRLDWNIANTVGWYFDVVCENLSDNQMARNIAHQDDRGCLTDAYGTIDTVYTYKFYHTIDAYSGASGSPIFKQNSLNICGVHSAGIHNNYIDTNTAYRVSTYLETWVADDIIDWAIDD